MELKERMVGKLNTVDRQFVLELLYLIALVMYLLRVSIQTTMMDIRFPQNYDITLRIITCAVVLIKTGYSKAYHGKEWCLCVITGIAFCFSWVSTGYTFLLDTPLLILGAFGVDYRKVLTVGFWVELYVLLTAFMGSLAGVFIDLTYSNGGNPEHSFGAVYTTDFAAHVAYLILIAWVIAAPILYPLLLALSAGAIIFLIRYNGSRCSIIVLCMSIAVMFYTVYVRRHLKKLLNGKLWDMVKAGAVALCAVIMVVLAWTYDSEKAWTSQMNALLSNRLELGKDAMTTYGIKMFGTPFAMTGNGGNTGYHFSYNFVDCSYAMVLVRYGWVMLAVLCGLSIWTAYKALRAGRGTLYWAVALVAVHSMIEHHLPELAYNLFLLAAFARIEPKTETTPAEHRDTISLKKRLVQKNAVKFAWCAVIFLIIMLSSSKGLGYLRTLAYILHLQWQPRYVWFVIIAALGFGVLAAFMLLTCKLIDLLYTPHEKKQLLFWGSCTLLLLLFVSGGLVKCDRILDRGRTEYEAMIEADRPYMEALSAADIHACVDELPALYTKECDNIRYTLLNRDGLAIKENTTLFINDTEELSLLMANNFWYGELSGDRAVYTNNPMAKEVLEQTGVAMLEYYGKRSTVDLSAAASANGLELTEDGTLLLEGSAKSLVHGPRVTIAKGRLRVRYRLHLLSADTDSEILATARVSFGAGAYIAKEVTVSLADFNENGECVLSIDVSLWTKFSGIEFLLFTTDGVTLEIEQISYGKTA